jgi:molybdenum cofactor synthesis domain-containing protein
MISPISAAVLVIGNEILTGRTQDVNLNYIAKKLMGAGIHLAEARIVRDIEADVVAAVNECRARYSYVFTTGGIGPTHDDITADCIAKAFGVSIGIHETARQILEKHYGDPAMLTEARLRMARIPATATLIDNPVSAAPGFRIGNVFVLAGVPSIMQAMFDGVLPNLQGGPPILSKTIGCYVPESLIADDLRKTAENFPDLDIGSYPYFRNGKHGTSLVFRGTKADEIDQALAAFSVAAVQRGFEFAEE